MIEVLRGHFQDTLGLPPAATEWLLMLWSAIQLFDDIADGDPVGRRDLDAVIVNTLVLMPGNPFFAANSAQLLPVMMNAVLKWKASDSAERNGKADAKSFVWRASYYDVVLMVVTLCSGVQAAMNAADTVMMLYGETFTDYMKEFEYA